MSSHASAAPRARRPSRVRVLIAFAAVYVIWGSTYLAIRYAIETIPPFLMAGARFLVSGVILYTVARARGAPAPTPAQWGGAALIGTLLLLGGNGGVTWSEQHVASGLVALLVATEPAFVVLIEWLRPGGTHPRRLVFAGLVTGLVGLALLVGPSAFARGGEIALGPAFVVLGASVAWAAGSVFSRHVPLPRSPTLTTGAEMLVGATLMLATGIATGEGRGFDLAAISQRSLIGVGYLIVFGGLVAFTAYIWLLQVAAPARVATYAYVNPVVAVFLGWAIAGEPLSARTLVAAAVIIAAVVLITIGQGGEGGGAGESTSEGTRGSTREPKGDAGSRGRETAHPSQRPKARRAARSR